MRLNLGGLPDLDAQLRQFLQPLRALFDLLRRVRRLSRKSEPWSTQSRPEAPASAAAGSRQQPMGSPVVARAVSSPTQAVKPQASIAVHRVNKRQQIQADLRDVDFLRRAIVVNEILDKPLALRRRRSQKAL